MLKLFRKINEIWLVSSKYSKSNLMKDTQIKVCLYKVFVEKTEVTLRGTKLNFQAKMTFELP